MCVTFRRDRKEDLSSLISLFLERQVRIASDPVYGNIQDRPIRATERPQIKPSQLEIALQLVRPFFPLSNLKVITYSCLAPYATAITH